ENPCLSLSEEQYTFVENLLKSVEKRINRENICNSSRQKQHLISELIKSWGQVICYELLNIYFSNEPQTPLPQDKKDKIFQNFMITLYRYYRQERDVTFYADKQCLSARYFSSVIKEKSGSSALQWIIQNVITEAKYLLDNTDLSIKEIATKLNFPTQSFFGKYFKQYVGISPKEYRNKLIKQ
ncbi:helix-turn-helix domain-containing protein, partial [Bacteroides ovatus]